MKLKGNGGYQIIDFEGQAPNTLDVDFFGNVIARGKPLWVNNLVVDGETYNGVASIKKTLTHIILVIATIQVVIALSDGATTYANVSESDVVVFGNDLTDVGLYFESNNITDCPITIGIYGDVNNGIVGLVHQASGNLTLYATGFTFDDFASFSHIAYNKKENHLVILAYTDGH